MGCRYFLSYFIYLSLLALNACQPQSTWRWTPVEEGLSRQTITLAVARDPNDPQNLWAGHYAELGLSYSQDGGQTWQPWQMANDDNPVFDILLTAQNTFVATRDGLLKQKQGDDNFSLVSGLTAVAVFVLAMDEQGQAYAGLDELGIYISDAEQETWQALSPQPELLQEAAILSLAISPSGQKLYAGTAGQGLFISQDGGQTWQRHYPTAFVPNVALKPSQPQIAVASLRKELVRTQDGGQTWHRLPLAWAEDEVLALLWLENAKALSGLWAGAGRGQVYFSPDEGQTWQARQDGLSPHGGILDLALAGERLLAGTWTGVYASDQDGLTWQYLSPSLGLPDATSLLSVDDQLFLGSRSGLYHWEAQTQTWQKLLEDLAAGGITALVAAPSTGQATTLYAGTAGNNLYRSDDKGRSWFFVPPERRLGVQALAASPTEADHLYMLAMWERMYESQDGGKSWVARWQGLGNYIEATSLAIDAQDPNILYLGTERGLYRSDCGGTYWQATAPSLLNQSILSIVSRADGTLYLGTTRGIYLSQDQGHLVSPWGTGLEDISVTAILFDPQRDDHVYVGTAFGGIYESQDKGATWHKIGLSDMDQVVIEAMAWGPYGGLFIVSPKKVWRGVRD